MKLQVGDGLFEPMSQNVGQITKIYDHPDGKIVKIRWRLDGHLPHDSEYSYKKVKRCVKNGQFEHTPKSTTESKENNA